MAVTRILEDTIGQDGNQTGSGETTFTRVMTVEVSATTDGPEIIFDNPSTSGSALIPSIGDAYTPASGGEDTTIYCVGVRAVRTGSRKVWRLIISYSKHPPSPDQTLTRPDLRDARVRWDSVTVQVPVLIDVDGASIVNTADEPFDPGITEEESWLMARITIFRETYNPLAMLAFHNKVNDAVWKGFKRRQVKCRKISAEDVYEWGQWWFAITYELEIRNSRIPATNFHNGLSELNVNAAYETANDISFAWTRWLLNRGYRQRVAGKLTHCVDPNKKFVLTTPALLAFNGTQLPPDQDALYIGYETLHEADFDNLGLGALDLSSGGH